MCPQEMATMSQTTASWGAAASCSTPPLTPYSPSLADSLADSPEGFERKRRKRVRASDSFELVAIY